MTIHCMLFACSIPSWNSHSATSALLSANHIWQALNSAALCTADEMALLELQVGRRPSLPGRASDRVTDRLALVFAQDYSLIGVVAHQKASVIRELERSTYKTLRKNPRETLCKCHVYD